MEIVNPVSGATPAWDGFWHLATPQVTPVSADRPTILIENRATEPYDLQPASSYDITPDSGDCTGGDGA